MIGFRKSRAYTRHGERRGAVLVMVALLLTVLLGFGAFAIDLSRVMAHRSELQRSADAAALAGALQLVTVSPQFADDVAVSYSSLNPVMGKPPDSITVEYGRWIGTFLTGDCNPNCGQNSASLSDAIRVQLSSSTPSIFAQVLGVDSSVVRAEAIAWASPNVELTDCVKPFAIPYQALTHTIDPSGNDNRALSQLDLVEIRRNLALNFCLKEGEICGPSDSPAPGAHLGRFLVVNLGGGQGNVQANVAACVSRKLGPDSVLSVLSGNWDYVSAVANGWLAGCDQFGSLPCAMKVALYDASSASASLCVPQTTGMEQCAINRIASVVITAVASGASSNPLLPPRVVLHGRFAASIDHGNVGVDSMRRTTLIRPILVQ